MKRWIPEGKRGVIRIGLVALLFGSMAGSFAHLQAQTPDSLLKRCATMDQLDREANPRVYDSFLRTQQVITEQARLRKHARVGETESVRIPVVVHIIHNRTDGAIGGSGNPNITKEQVESQLRILNEDYRRLPGTPGENSHPAGVDTQIEFFLAELDPEGGLTDGITRNLYTQKSSFSTSTDRGLLAQIKSWPTDAYLNIWVCTLTANYLGYAQFPSVAGIPGLDDSQAGAAVTDGVIIDYRYFGDTGAVTGNLYNRGRTTTHEVGHWLGLLHIWGDARCGDDYCDDTPWAERSNETGSCDDMFSNCKGAVTQNMIENYMDYSPDRCMNIFTQDQMQRMHTVLGISPRRVLLVENSKRARLEETPRLQVSIYPNPVQDQRLTADVQFTGFDDISVAILDVQGRVRDTTYYEKTWSRRITREIAGLTRGIYFLQINTGSNEKVIRRFVVN